MCVHFSIKNLKPNFNHQSKLQKKKFFHKRKNININFHKRNNQNKQQINKFANKMKNHTSFFIFILAIFDLFYIALAGYSSGQEQEYQQVYCQLYKQFKEFEFYNQIYLLSKQYNHAQLLGQDAQIDIKAQQKCLEALDKSIIDISYAKQIIFEQDGLIILFLKNDEGSHLEKQVLCKQFSFLIML
ncbi:transmembrane protein, putative (macronuclear) [Tetrahymena thermophila SB210]|uniref:Transmembrane protein, putative n=1 Tax=Tetrahymena thermophila (strain SB210) TaxID=312017 RepID=I7M1L2_TETTS|nr:transmembrane protein, putative [Tetrahymena thermophila SB210]EAR97109.2 transmembrane protein, putative [Tetrahymena thermophila SB210]|eukprot:XP_001017354.2 transmembrane protein, putative [Tetrahymena thermophila SB210]